jgi:hypothetical protein
VLKKGRPELDLIDQTVGILTVVSRFGKNRHGLVEWQCRCACGAIVIQTTSEIRRGQRDQRDSSCANCAKQRGRERSLRASGAPRSSKARCKACEGLGHRRDRSGCKGCREPYAPEEPVSLEPGTPGCGLARFETL